MPPHPYCHATPALALAPGPDYVPMSVSLPLTKFTPKTKCTSMPTIETTSTPLPEFLPEEKARVTHSGVILKPTNLGPQGFCFVKHSRVVRLGGSVPSACHCNEHGSAFPASCCCTVAENCISWAITTFDDYHIDYLKTLCMLCGTVYCLYSMIVFLNVFVLARFTVSIYWLDYLWMPSLYT